MGLSGGFRADGFATFPATARGRAWAAAARQVARRIASDAGRRAANLRHGGTWFVGVDALDNAADGSVGGVALRGAWTGPLGWTAPWHRGQLSIIYPGYPGRDPGTGQAAHRYRVSRCAAHVDGLLPVGPGRRRYAREYHAFVLGLPLTDGPAAPTVVWRGSHRVMHTALARAIGGRDPATVDVTEAYHAARREVFERCERVVMPTVAGGAFLLDRFALHGTMPWDAWVPDPDGDGRMVAFFRPALRDAPTWLAVSLGPGT